MRPTRYIVAGWSSLVAREAHNLEVVGSNPAPATHLTNIVREVFYSPNKCLSKPAACGSEHLVLDFRQYNTELIAMSSRRIPSYRHHKARDLAVVTLDGKDIYLGDYNSPDSKAKYDALIADWLCRNHEPPPPGAECSLCELMAAYLVFAKGYYVKEGKETREFGSISEALREVRKRYENATMSKFGPRALKAVREKMVELGWSRKYINKQIGRIVRMVKWGVSEELVNPTVHQALTTVTGLRKGRTTAPDHKPIMPVKDSDIDATILHLTIVVGDMVRLQRLSGARPGEITSLRPMDIQRDGAVWAYRPDSHKTEHHERDRVVFFGPRAQQILKRYPAVDDSRSLYS